RPHEPHRRRLRSSGAAHRRDPADVRRLQPSPSLVHDARLARMVPLVEQLAATWKSIGDLCTGLTDSDWSRPTGCPGWTVQDQVAHLIDYESFALGRPRPEHAVAELRHIKNDMGKINEIGVDVRRARSGAEVLAEFEDVMAERLERLSALTDDDLDGETATPAGPGTVRDLL